MIEIVGAVGAALIGFFVGWIFRKRVEHTKLDNAEQMAESILTEAAAQAETLKKTAELESKDEWYRAKAEFERESGTARQELGRTEKRITAKEQNLDRKADMLAKKERAADVLHRGGDRPSILVDELLVRVGDLDERGVVLEYVLRNLRQQVTNQRRTLGTPFERVPAQVISGDGRIQRRAGV